jgi:hypothetical protein
MKKLTFLVTIIASLFLLQSSAFSQGASLFGQIIDGLSQDGQHHNKVMAWAGAHNDLYGYIDRRYQAQNPSSSESRVRDQGDYIKSDSQYSGFEFYVSDFSYISKSLADMRFGFNVAMYHRDRYKQKTLYPVSIAGIPQETFPPTETKAIERWWFNPGFFVGADKKWIAVDLGLTMKSTIIVEKTRQRLDINGVYQPVKGRGAMFENSEWLMNFYFRLGPEDKPHFVLSVYRDDYDPVYGVFQSKMCFPLGAYFNINVGGYLYKTQSVFLEPGVRFFGVELSVKAGMIINYHDKAIARTSIKDSIYGACQLSYVW